MSAPRNNEERRTMKTMTYKEYLSGKVDCNWWSCREDAERLSCMSIDEAIDQHIDDCHPTTLDELGEISAYAYELNRPTLESLGDPLEWVLESLSEENSAPGDGQYPSQAMIAATRRYQGEILRLWHAEGRQYMCYATVEVVLDPSDVRAWCADRYPELLGDCVQE